MNKAIINSFLFFLIFSGSINCAQTFLPPSDAQKTDKKRVIIIDPGHGGGDWGISYRGLYEKNVTLDVAKRIRDKLLKDNPKVVVYMTRMDDQFLSMNDRANYANKMKGDIFVSIHCDFVPSENISGFKTFFLLSPSIPDKEKKELVNWDFVQLPYIAASKKLASFIDQYMKAALIKESNTTVGGDEDDILPLESRGVAGIKSFILKSVNMPAVVIEIGNFNNKNDFACLNDKNVINQIAYHIKEGIVNYLNKTIYQ